MGFLLDMRPYALVMETELLLLDNINSRGRVWGSVKGREGKAVITVVVVVVVVDGAMR